MNNLLRISLILLLILSIAALAMGWMLFDQRQEIKGRLLAAEDTLVEVARTIERETPAELTDRDLPKMQIDRNQLQTYYGEDDQGNVIVGGPGTMDEVLRQLRGRAASQYAYYNDTRAALKQTREELAAKETEIEAKEEQLAQSIQAREQAEAEKTAALNSLGERDERIAGLNREMERMEGRIEEQRERVAELNDDVADLRQRNESKLAQIEDLRRRIAERPTVEDLDSDRDPIVETRDVMKGHKGQVLLVNRDWNFVILNMARDDHSVRRDLTLFVQRDDKLVGKVRVSDIKGDDRRLAVADIMDDWLQMPIEEGDYVFF